MNIMNYYHLINIGAQQAAAQGFFVGMQQMNAFPCFHGSGQLRNVYAIIEKERIACAKMRYPAWFEPASEWNNIP